MVDSLLLLFCWSTVWSSLDRVFSFPAIRPKVAMPDLPEEVVEDLSSDQHYGYRYGKGSYLRLSDHETMRP